MEACDLVGPGGRFPSPLEEQDVVLELGNLWYHRYALLTEKVDSSRETFILRLKVCRSVVGDMAPLVRCSPSVYSLRYRDEVR